MTKSACELFYDRVAHNYDHMYQTAYWEFYNAVVWHNLKKYLPSNMASKILDIGGGTGLWALKLAKSGYKVTLSDISHKMLDVGRQKAETMGLSARLEFIKADICDLSAFTNEAFDLVIAQGDPLSYCDNSKQAMKELYRVLKPAGILIASVDNKLSGMKLFIRQGLVDEFETFTRTGQSKWFTRDEAEQYPITFFTPDELRVLLSHSGFEVLSLIGKMVLPLGEVYDAQKRQTDSSILKDPKTFDRLLKLELKFHATEALLGGASHLEIVGKKI